MIVPQPFDHATKYSFGDIVQVEHHKSLQFAYLPIFSAFISEFQFFGGEGVFEPVQQSMA